MDGIGALMTDSELTVVDIDVWIGFGEFCTAGAFPENEAELVAWLSRFDGMALIEISPSGKGLHLFIAGNKRTRGPKKSGWPRYGNLHDERNGSDKPLSPGNPERRYGLEVQALGRCGKALQIHLMSGLWSAGSRTRGGAGPKAARMVLLTAQYYKATKDFDCRCPVLKLLKQNNKRGKITHP